MAESPNLGIIHVEQFQSSKHATVNTGFDRIDNSMHQTKSTAVDDDLETDIGTTTQFQENGRFDITGALTANENINLPAGINRWFFIRNSTTGGFVVTVQVTGGGGLGVIIESGTWYTLYTDAVDVTMISKSSPNLVAFGGYALGSGASIFATNQILMRTPMAFDVTFPAAFAGATSAVLQVAATASTTFDVRTAASDGSGEASIGSIIFGVAGVEATFATAGGTAQAVAEGEILIIRAPGTADVGAEGLGFTLVADKD